MLGVFTLVNKIMQVLEGVFRGGSKKLLPQKAYGPISSIVIERRDDGITAFLNVFIFLFLVQRYAKTLLSLVDLIFGSHWSMLGAAILHPFQGRAR